MATGCPPLRGAAQVDVGGEAAEVGVGELDGAAVGGDESVNDGQAQAAAVPAAAVVAVGAGLCPEAPEGAGFLLVGHAGSAVGDGDAHAVGQRRGGQLDCSACRDGVEGVVDEVV